MGLPPNAFAFALQYGVNQGWAKALVLGPLTDREAVSPEPLLNLLRSLVVRWGHFEFISAGLPNAP